MGKDLNRYLTKEDKQTRNSIWKDNRHHMPKENCKLKQHWGTIIHLLEWSNPNHRQYQMLTRM